MVISITQPPDELPLIRITLLQANSFLEDQTEITDRGNILIHLDTIQKTVTLTLSPWCLWPHQKPLLLEGSRIGDMMGPLITISIKRSCSWSWIMTPVLTINGYGWQMSKGTSIQGVLWMLWKVRSTKVSQMGFGECGFTKIECWEIQLRWLWTRWSSLTNTSIVIDYCRSSMQWPRGTTSQ